MKHKTFLNLMLMFILTSTLLSAQTIYQWRGTDRSGIYNEKGLLSQWPASGPKLLWEYEGIGNGYGSPVITSDRMYILGEIDSTGYLFAFDLMGKMLWKSSYEKEWTVSYTGSRCAPTVVNDLIYLSSGFGNMACFDAKTGKRMWFVDMKKELHGRFTLFGHSESPLVFKEKVYLVPGGADTSVVALNRFSGKIEWICKANMEIPGYNSPSVITLPNRNIIITFTAYSFLGIDADTGKLLWQHAQDNVPVLERKPGNGDTHSNTAIYDNGFIYYIAGDGNCAVKLKLSQDGSQIEQVWRNKTIDNYMGGFVKIGEKIFTCTNSRKDLKCLDANTGIATDSLKCGIGAVIAADNKLFYYNQKGEVSLINYLSGKLETVSTFKITKGTKEHFSHPVIDNGVFYIRRGNIVQAYLIK